jgi:predicted PhzF superfamily epimerase YddE/YHI9
MTCTAWPGSALSGDLSYGAPALPFAGHPTLGTCHAWLSATGTDKDRVVQECKAGTIPIRCKGDVRAFFPTDGGTGEDPVTGSLNASLAEWLLRTGRVRAPYVASQGSALGRRGRVHISVDDEGTIWVGGRTITCVSGTVSL